MGNTSAPWECIVLQNFNAVVFIAFISTVVSTTIRIVSRTGVQKYANFNLRLASQIPFHEPYVLITGYESENTTTSLVRLGCGASRSADLRIISIWFTWSIAASLLYFEAHLGVRRISFLASCEMVLDLDARQLVIVGCRDLIHTPASARVAHLAAAVSVGVVVLVQCNAGNLLIQPVPVAVEHKARCTIVISSRQKIRSNE